MLLLTPRHWQEYELIDCGNFEKLERFGKIITARPEPQAVWDKSLSEEAWLDKAHAYFTKEKNNPERGQWEFKSDNTAPNWYIRYQTEALALQFKLSFSSFKHVGIFPEQAENWDFIAKEVERLKSRKGEGVGKPKVLNLFAYTGGATLASCQAGADVTHLDSVKPVVTWARENLEASKLEGVRWIVEDALKFVKREARRGNHYQGIILDPPAYGRGAEGEKWVLEEQINEILSLCASLLDEEKHFLVLNTYSLGFSALIVENLLKAHFANSPTHEFGELYLQDSFQKKLPLGVFGRVAK
ncbi:MAG: oxidoreductase [Bacteroidetes bacterium]|nr:MAG: oxidoreductase [Bacteroidota bacterium]